MDLLIGIIAFVVILSVIVTVHELGHFMAAKHFGVFCGEFSIGMGPIIWKKQGRETQYSIRALPLGGFVSMAGEEDDTKKDIEVPFERTINGIKAWQKVIVMMAGIVMNILLAWIIFIGVSMYQGVATNYSLPVLSEIVEGGPADKAGIEDHDLVISIEKENGKVIPIESYQQLREEINLDPQTFIFKIQRPENGEDEIIEIPLTPEYDEEKRTYTIGVSAAITYREIAWYESFSVGTKEMIDNSSLIFKSLGKLVQGKNLNQLSGPVGIYEITSEAFHTDLLVYIQLFAILSLNVGIFNAIPIPILDGGRVVLTILEKIMKRPINEKLLNGIMYVGMFMMLGLMVYATWNDILRLF